MALNGSAHAKHELKEYSKSSIRPEGPYESLKSLIMPKGPYKALKGLGPYKALKGLVKPLRGS